MWLSDMEYIMIQLLPYVGITCLVTLIWCAVRETNRKMNKQNGTEN